METVFRWLLLEDFGDLTGTNSEEVANEYKTYSNYTVIDTQRSTAWCESNEIKIPETPAG